MPASFIKFRLLMLLGAVFFCARILPAQTWTLANAPTNANWYSVAIPSGNGPMVAVVNGGGIYTSTNQGSSWQQTSAPNKSWLAAAAATNGMKLFAAVYKEGIYSSTNLGNSWTLTGAPMANWFSIASSDDGMKLAAVANAGDIYTSTNSGAAWKNYGAGGRFWIQIVSSSDGSRLMAALYGGGIYTSTNSGTTWMRTVAQDANWSSVATSSDGLKLAACIYGEGIYTSTNGGTTWSKTAAPNANWFSVASSVTGQVLLAGVDGGGIYTSTNFGGSWQQTGAPVKNWYSVATSLHGSQFVGVVHGGGIYNSKISIDQSVTTPENTPTNIVLTSGYLDGTTPTFSFFSTNASLTGFNPATGSVTYTPPTNYHGVTNFAFRVFDGSIYSTGILTLTVTDVNFAPVASNQTVTLPEDTTTNLVLTAGDADGDPLTYSIVSNPTVGSLTGLNTNTGAVTYTPPANYNGTNSFTFRVSDGSLAVVRTVTIIVTPVYDGLMLTNLEITMPEDTTTNLVLPVVNPDKANLTYGIVAAPTNGKLSQTNSATTIYGPTANYNGPDSFGFWVTDGFLYWTGIITITITAVNDAPVAANLNEQILKNSALNLVLHGTDVDSSNLAYAILANPTNGTLSEINTNTGAVTYSPSNSGEDHFTFTVFDGSLYATGTVAITISDVPVAISQTVVMAANTSTNLVLHGNSAGLWFFLADPPTHGSLGASDIDLITGAATYTPELGYTGTDSFAFMVLDVLGDLQYSEPGTVSITVTPALWLDLMCLPDTQQLRFSWNTNVTSAAEYVLQQNTNLTTTNWINVGVTPTNHLDQLVAVIPQPTNSMLFYRLKR